MDLRNLALATTIVVAMPFHASADTANLSATGANVLNLVAGNAYAISFGWATGAYSYWDLNITPSSNGYSWAGGGNANPDVQGTGNINATYVAPSTGAFTFSFTKGNLLSAYGLAPEVTITNPTVAGTFAAPGPVAGTGLLASIATLLAALGLRRRSQTA